MTPWRLQRQIVVMAAVAGLLIGGVVGWRLIDFVEEGGQFFFAGWIALPIVAVVALLTQRTWRLASMAEEAGRARDEAENLLDASPDPMLTVGVDGYIQRANIMAAQYFGYPHDELIGMSVERLIPQRYRQRHVGLRGGFFHSPSYRPMGSGAQLRALLASGEERDVAISLSHSGVKHSALAMVTLRDMTDQNRMVADITAAKQELEAFSYSVSHDLRGPLRSMDGFSLAILEDYGDQLDDAGRDMLLRIRNASQRMGHLVDSLLALARITRTDLKLQQVDLSEIANEIAATLGREHPERTVVWLIEKNLKILADQTLMHIVMQNLLDNAFKFTANTAQQVIRVGRLSSEPDRRASRVYLVADNGAGFDMKYADRLFGPFQRLHHSADYPGVGVGLATVQRIIRRHEGRVWVEAREGEGATFFFSVKEPENE